MRIFSGLVRSVFIVTLVCFCQERAIAGTGAIQRPNIVFILADDLDELITPFWDHATSKGLDDPLKKTRALLVNKGVRFTNSYAPTSICCPARTTLLTGQYGHNTGVLTNGGPNGGEGAFRRNGNEPKTLAKQLQTAGYKTALIGKYLNGVENDPTHVPSGWSEWYGFSDTESYNGYNYVMNENGHLVNYGGPDALAPDGGANYSTDVVARKAVDFINRAHSDDTQPFFLYVTPTAPHAPLPPAPRHANHPYVSASTPVTPNYMEPDISDKSPWLQKAGTILGVEGLLQNRKDYRNRQGSLYALDDLVENIFNALQQNGQLENTYVVFASDNGYNLGSHRLLQKMVPYEEAIRVPMAMRGPGIPEGIVRNEMVAQVDFAPTVFEWTGVTPRFEMDGRSLTPLLGTQSVSQWRSDLLLQFEGGGATGIELEIPKAFEGVTYLFGDVPSYHALRTQGYLYVDYEVPSSLFPHQKELYDLKKDPYQLNNLLANPVAALLHAKKIKELRQRMDILSICKGTNCW